MKVYLINLLVYLLFIIMNIIRILISLAFLTLLERKLLGRIQLRKGPNKVGVLGLFQPFRDAIKLFFKERLFLIKFNKFIYLCMPGAIIFLILII